MLTVAPQGSCVNVGFVLPFAGGCQAMPRHTDVKNRPECSELVTPFPVDGDNDTSPTLAEPLSGVYENGQINNWFNARGLREHDCLF